MMSSKNPPALTQEIATETHELNQSALPKGNAIEASGQAQPVPPAPQDNNGLFSFLNMGALMRSAMPRIPSLAYIPLRLLIFSTPILTRRRAFPIAKENIGEDSKLRLILRKPKLAQKPLGRHAECLAGYVICRPEPHDQWRAPTDYYRFSNRTGVMVATSTTKNSGMVGKTERFAILVVNGAHKFIGPTRLLKAFGTGRIIREKTLKLRKRLWERTVISLDNIQDHDSWTRFMAAQLQQLAGVGVDRVREAPVPQCKPMPHRIHDPMPDDNYYELVEAAHLARCTETVLLESAAAGNIKLCIRTPQSEYGIELLPYDTKKERKGTTFYPPVLLVLNPEYCIPILSAHKTRQSKFKKAYMLGRDGLTLLLPGRANLDIENENSYEWRAFREGELYPIEIKQEDILVPKDELKYFMLENPTQIDELSPDDIFKPESYTSDKLINLDRAARHFWGQIYSENEEYPANEGKDGVEDWLVNYYNFSRTSLAKAGATIIRPEYAKAKGVKPLRSEQIKRQSYMTDEFQLLVEVSKRAWENADFNDMETCPKQECVETLLKDAWLRKGKGILSDHLARAGASIIRPEKARNGRPTSDSKE